MKKHEQEPSTPQRVAAPVIVWEQTSADVKNSENNVVPIESFRNPAAANADSEATVISRSISSAGPNQPIRLLIVSSGFGQKPYAGSSTVQGKAA